jgi:hypothetical protein
MIVAHVFLAPYTLPVPFWLYLYGCAATLVISFALLAYLATSGLTTHRESRHELVTGPLTRRLWGGVVLLLRAGALAALVLSITAGFAGPANPALNIGMTLFWVCFLLAFVYLTVVVGDLYEWISPWRTLSAALERAGIDVDRPRLGYPRAASYWPAVALYVALVWIELFALPRPFTLAVALTVYTVVTLGGVLAFGRAVWLRHGEVFGVFFSVIGALAPIGYPPGGGDTPRVVLRRPLSGASRRRADDTSLVVFILFMLSSTTYDAIHETYLWIGWYWQRLLPLLQPLWGTDVIAAQATLTTGYWWYQWLGLVASPLFYLLLYLAVLWMAAGLTRAGVRLGALSGLLVFSLVPIAVAYHATHYAPSMLQQLPALLPQLADPFGRGWLLLSFQYRPAAPLPMSIVWHLQVAVLLIGHVAGVYLAHLAALGVFPTRVQGIMSQLPMLVLMVGYTCLGLWVLSLPLGLPQIAPSGG